ncbi:DUF4440 domain-containing protein [Duganella sp. FT94W]|uniref:DUF4440 domain-containing protein n=1 Tax=Duganella lactea TaxID=2692173 RepID=A0ABW9V3Y8_9BURK|nr:nuclear transport factor 2 family protein [Duganella lactea]MYM33631.1 DUF4440 domain-containing protein [Duganella lactea]
MTFKYSSIYSLLAFLLLAGCSHSRVASSESYAQAERYIIACSHDWAESVVTGDRSKRRIYFADDFIGTDTKGRRYDKSQVTRETGPAKQIISNKIDDLNVKFFGDTAIAHGSETWIRKDGSTGRYVWTDIWIKRDGKWQVIAAQDAAAPPQVVTPRDGNF